MKKKILISFLSAIGIIIIFFVVGIIYFIIPSCNDDLISELSSLDNNYKAISYERDCGATTDVSTNIKIIKKKKLWDKKNTVFTAKGSGDIEFSWNKNSLIVKCLDCGQVFNKQESWENVKINYELK
jgi:hypothetical protein